MKYNYRLHWHIAKTLAYLQNYPGHLQNNPLKCRNRPAQALSLWPLVPFVPFAGARSSSGGSLIAPPPIPVLISSARTYTLRAIAKTEIMPRASAAHFTDGLWERCKEIEGVAGVLREQETYSICSAKIANMPQVTATLPGMFPPGVKNAWL
jgi:hypothetical protein